MKQARQTEDDLSRIRELMDAGHRGRPIGGEVLVVLGALLAIVFALQGLTAFGFLPLWTAPSPLAAAATFLAFAVFAGGGGDGTRSVGRALLSCLAAGALGELVWRGALYLMRTGGVYGGRVDTGTFWVVIGFLGLAVLAGLLGGAVLALRRLRHDPTTRSPANRAVTGGWLAVLSAFAIVLAIIAVSGLHTGFWASLGLIPSLFWTLWGIGWWISAQATGRRWMMLVVAGSWIEALWSAWFGEIYASATIGFIGLAVLPGIKLLGEVRRAADEA